MVVIIMIVTFAVSIQMKWKLFRRSSAVAQIYFQHLKCGLFNLLVSEDAKSPNFFNQAQNSMSRPEYQLPKRGKTEAGRSAERAYLL